MIDSEKLDFAVVATPTKFHYPMVKYAFDNNINIFCNISPTLRRRSWLLIQ